MKIEHKIIYDDVVSGKSEVHIPITKDKATELRQALKVVDKYRKIAETRVKTKTSDWAEFEYCVKNDKVIVIVTDGACG